MAEAVDEIIHQTYCLFALVGCENREDSSFCSLFFDQGPPNDLSLTGRSFGGTNQCQLVQSFGLNFRHQRTPWIFRHFGQAGA